MESLGKVIIGFGVLIVVVGVLVFALGRLGLRWPLPGDIVIRRENVTFYFPIVTMILISLILTLLLWIFTALRR